MLSKKDSQNFKLKLKLPALLRSPFTRRSKKKAAVAGEGAPRTSTSSYEVNITPNGPSQADASKADSDTLSTPQSRTSADVNENQHGLAASISHEAGSADGHVSLHFSSSAHPTPVLIMFLLF